MERIRLGLILDRNFHNNNRWVSAITPQLVNHILEVFDCHWIENQQDYENAIHHIDAILSMEPGWAAPRIDFKPTPQVTEAFRNIPSYILYSDPHENQWREDYFLTNEIRYILTYYKKPTLHHFSRIHPQQVIHFPWAIPDNWISDDLVRYRGQRQILCFGASGHDAYAVRNWVRTFPFVQSEQHSGVENPILSDEEYIYWLGRHDAIIAAGSDDPGFRLTVPKYFEIAASGALLFAQETDELEDAGFRHMENCVIFNRNTFETLAYDYLQHSYDFIDIREAGRKLITDRHLMSTRLLQLENHIRNEISNNKQNSASVISVNDRPAVPAQQTRADIQNTSFDFWFEKICDKDILHKSRTKPLSWENRPLEWEVNHEIYAYEEFCKGQLTADQLIGLSNARYVLLDQLWPKGPLTRQILDSYYISTAAILPWGHGVFAADHNISDRRKNWMRRLELLRDLQQLGVSSVVDYGAGGGHTSLLARAMGFDRVVHHEYSIFHSYVAWRAGLIQQDANGHHCGRFDITAAEQPLKLDEPVDAILCLDVPEHVYDPDAMLEEIRGSLKPGGYLVWVAMFEENISCHLHPHLRGKEDELLRKHGFTRDHDLPVHYDGHTGVYKLTAQPQTMSHAPAVNQQPTAPMSLQFNKPAAAGQYTHKPKVLFLVDAPGWAHDLKTANLERFLQNDYSIDKKFIDKATAEDIESADLVVIYYWLQIQAVPHLETALRNNRNKVLIGICSHYELEGNWQDQGIAVLNSMARAVFVNSLLLYRQYSPLLTVPVYYTPNGVDTAFYQPAIASRPATSTLRVGWSGSLSNRPESNDIDHKGFVEFIKPAVERVANVELVTAIREERWRGPDDMRDFYQSLDLYICASHSEGTPNPCLEAAACGVPILTTPVGNMPELIVHGVNGLFIERDLDDITSKLELLRDNRTLLQSLSAHIVSDIAEWDWQIMAGNYRYLFQSVLDSDVIADGSVHNRDIFSSSKDVYIASADRMDMVQQNLQQLSANSIDKIDTYATVIGGLSGLNYLLNLDPARIVFFDVNAASIPYAKLIVELISISSTPEEFISRVFGRSVDNFNSAYGKLDISTQDTYLGQAIDQSIVNQTLASLTTESSLVYQSYISPYHTNATISGVRNCCRLLPCWPDNERVPVGAGQELGTDEYGKLVPNTNTFFYGSGWLESAQSFAKVRNSLQAAELSFIPFNLLEHDIRLLADPQDNVALHTSNIDDWFPEQWTHATDKWIRRFIASQGKLSIITSANGTGVLTPEPHLYAYMGIAPYVFGTVVEVTHKVPWGFHEFDRINVSTLEYLAGQYHADTTILHILIGEGRSLEEFVEVCQHALHHSKRVIIIEHNRDSMDWMDNNQRYTSAEDLLTLISQASANIDISLTSFNTLRGERDGCRNMFFVLDIATDKRSSQQTHGAQKHRAINE